MPKKINYPTFCKDCLVPITKPYRKSRRCTPCGRRFGMMQHRNTIAKPLGREKYRARARRFYHLNKERIKAKNRLAYRISRQEALMHYGGSCTCCGETIYEFLAFDHIDGGGNKHRKALKEQGRTSTKLASWLKDNNYPKGFRVLCHNCNMALGFYGKCPHDNQLMEIN